MSGPLLLLQMFNSTQTFDVGDVWPEYKDNLLMVSWAHAVNSKEKLEKALKGKTEWL